MKEIFLTIIFFSPGLAMKVCYKFFNRKRNEEDSNIYEYVFEVITHGCIVFAFAISILNLLGKMLSNETLKIRTISAILDLMDGLLFDALYVAIVFACTIAWYNIFYRWVRPLFEKKKNSKYAKENGCTVISNCSVYEKIFHDPENKGHLLPVEILKDGQRITCGLLQRWNSPNSPKKEYELRLVKIIRKYIDGDGESEKLLSKIDREYYDPDTGLLIRFYNSEKLEAKFNEDKSSEIN